MKDTKQMIIAVDFDGTIVSHRFPEIGKDIGAVPVLKNLIENGHKIILNTMRSHMPYNGVDTLQEALDWLSERGIEPWAVNENPEQMTWTNSHKIYANLYIDDAALGCPKKKNEEGEVIVDWGTIDTFFKQIGLINTIIKE